jgi:hypothetical protein
MAVYFDSCNGYFDQITRSCDDRLQKWCAAIAARTRITIAARKSKTGEWLGRTELNKVGVGF